jgi:hypothetical protein
MILDARWTSTPTYFSGVNERLLGVHAHPHPQLRPFWPDGRGIYLTRLMSPPCSSLQVARWDRIPLSKPKPLRLRRGMGSPSLRVAPPYPAPGSLVRPQNSALFSCPRRDETAAFSQTRHLPAPRSRQDEPTRVGAWAGSDEEQTRRRRSVRDQAPRRRRDVGPEDRGRRLRRCARSGTASITLRVVSDYVMRKTRTRHRARK